jgi:hypothetical protein
MKEKPILFSGPMVRAILDGRKTQTRRIIKPQPPYPIYAPDYPRHVDKDIWYFATESQSSTWDGMVVETIKCPYKVGGILWVRETWHPKRHGMPTGWKYEYRATAEEDGNPTDEPWKPSIFMPKDACRIKLRVTDVRAERLQDISWYDAVAEGCSGYRPTQYEPTHEYRDLWGSINGKGSWDKNPWVWVITFERI